MNCSKMIKSIIISLSFFSLVFLVQKSNAKFIIPQNSSNIFEDDVSHPEFLLENQELTYKLAVIWPNGYCREYPRNPGYKNREKLPRTFTIHGLWAIDHSKTKIPSTQQFDVKLLSDIKERMLVAWPDIKDYEVEEKKKGRNVKAAEQFWDKEWKKHGQVDPLFKNQFHGYFQHTLNLFEDLDITNVLINQAGKPNNPESLRQALSSRGIRVPQILCSAKEKYISELHFCMDGTATQFVDCAPKEGSLDKKDCKEGETFFY